MTEEPPDSDARGPTPSSPRSEVGPDWDPDSPGDESTWADRSGVALDMARLWVKEHQTTTMLGAFAVGVFVGAIVRSD